MGISSPTAARPWTFRLRVLTIAGLLSVVGLIGSAALARRADTDARATLKSDLQRFDAAQRAWQARYGDFAQSFDAKGSPTAIAFTPSPGVTFKFESFSPQAWSATVTGGSDMVAPRMCGIFRGEGPIAPHRALITEGAIACW